METSTVAMNYGTLTTIAFGFIGALLFEMIFLKIFRVFLFYTIVEESSAQVYVLFGKVCATITEPGIHFLWPRLTWKALVINFLGNVYNLDLRMDQSYLRSQAVNSEEGAPMGVGIWYEMFISDPISYLFKNSNPRGSLADRKSVV